MRRVLVCLAVTCHLYFWQNGLACLWAAALTRRNGHQHKSQRRKGVEGRERSNVNAQSAMTVSSEHNKR